MSETVKSFRDLRVYQLSFQMALQLHRLSDSFPKEERFGGITDQMRRASKSICANIAEGFGRWSSKTEERRYLSMALGSLEETCLWLDFGLALKYLDSGAHQNLNTNYDEVRRMLKSMMYKRR